MDKPVVVNKEKSVICNREATVVMRVKILNRAADACLQDMCRSDYAEEYTLDSEHESQ